MLGDVAQLFNGIDIATIFVLLDRNLAQQFTEVAIKVVFWPAYVLRVLLHVQKTITYNRLGVRLRHLIQFNLRVPYMI
jgi:hypothetical protein